MTTQQRILKTIDKQLRLLESQDAEGHSWWIRFRDFIENFESHEAYINEKFDERLSDIKDQLNER